jgi:hypothetical protein
MRNDEFAWGKGRGLHIDWNENNPYFSCSLLAHNLKDLKNHTTHQIVTTAGLGQHAPAPAYICYLCMAVNTMPVQSND